MKEIRNPNGFQGNQPKSIVVHVMGEYLDHKGERLHASEFLKRIGFSAHRLVEPDGTTILCRNDNEGAYHVGGYNQDSLGIEMLVPDAHNIEQLQDRVMNDTWLSAEQFKATVKNVREWMDQYGIPVDKVYRHSDLDPENKWFDPGESFPWQLFLEELQR